LPCNKRQPTEHKTELQPRLSLSYSLALPCANPHREVWLLHLLDISKLKRFSISPTRRLPEVLQEEDCLALLLLLCPPVS
jgi:hypothetical protein